MICDEIFYNKLHKLFYNTFTTDLQQTVTDYCDRLFYNKLTTDYCERYVTDYFTTNLRHIYNKLTTDSDRLL